MPKHIGRIIEDHFTRIEKNEGARKKDASRRGA